MSAQAALATNAEGVIAPETARQREMFLDVVLVPHFKKIAQADLAGDYRERYRRKMRGDLNPQQSASASTALESLVAAELSFTFAKNAAIVDYVREAPSLAKPGEANPHPGKGVGGVISYGMEPEWRAFWGPADGIRVSYWLAFDDYPDLARANRELLARRTDFAPFASKR